MRKRCCPRCGSRGYEVLKTHAHCPQCLYSPDLDEHFEPDIPLWAHKFMPKESEVSLEALLKESAPRVGLSLPVGGPGTPESEETPEI